MGSFTTEYAHTILDQLTGVDAPYLALFTESPGDAGSVTDEVDASEYEREDLGDAEDKWEDAGATTDREINTNALIEFAKATSTWGTISHLALAAAATEAVEDLKCWGELTTSKVIENGDQLTFESGNITVKILAG